MALIHDLCDDLARDVMAAMDEIGDDRLHEKVAKIMGDSSAAAQEAFISSIRGLIAERRARSFVLRTLDAKRRGMAAPVLPPGSID
jgi:hypothetical protein